ncbi:ATP-dependent bile acid permease [Auricularia subglabra TFB-10046 SS5]|nr:ATP-dependent bile acid permease [Auricularia subglabra TFB-10046 SS5]
MGLLQGLYNPEPAPSAFARDATIPETSSSIFSRLTFGWISPLLWVGFSRPLEKDDLWELPEWKRAHRVADAFAFEYERARHRSQLKREVKAAKNAVQAAQAGDPKSGANATEWSHQLDLLRALHSRYFWSFWGVGILQLVADALTVSAPLLTEKFLSYLTSAYLDANYPGSVPPPRPVEYGLTLAASLALVQFVTTVIRTQTAQISLNMTMSASAALNRNVFEKSLRVSGRARVEHTKGQITNLFSQDTEQVVAAIQSIHTLWVAPIQLTIGIVLLVRMLGVAAWVGLGSVFISFPFQAVILSLMMNAIVKSMAVTDKRIRIMQEVLQGIRAIKIYAWERFFEGKIWTLRSEELALIRSFSLAMSWLFALVTGLPVVAATLAFVTYSLKGHILTPATVFSALQIFNMLRAPIVSIPATATMLLTAKASLQRLTKFLNAEEVAEPFPIDTELSDAIQIDADFTWEEQAAEKDTSTPTLHATSDKADKPTGAQAPADSAVDSTQAESDSASATQIEPSGTATPTSTSTKHAPFALSDLKMTVPRGSFVALVGQVGSGKTSIMEALAGEMRTTRGDVLLGGAISYAPQTPWIVNGTVKDNIVFGSEPVDEERYTRCLRACALEHDIATLAHQDRTEIGERGINLSGGQKARVNLARVAYSTADIVLLDDPLSAVDAHVGQHLLNECLLSGPLSGRTRLLATHALHVLPHVDYIYVLERGTIAEHGTYEHLRGSGGAFSRLLEEHGTGAKELERRGEQLDKEVDEATTGVKDGAANTALIQDEDRAVGQVPWSTYRDFFAASGSVWFLPLLLLLAIASRAIQVASQLSLGWWSSQRFPGWTNKDYITVYATLGALMAVSVAVTTFSFMAVTLRASGYLFQGALDHVMRSPVVFFDTTPMGRIVSRLTKDVKTIDMGIGMKISELLSILLTVVSTVGLIFYTFPAIGGGVLPLSVVYVVYFLFYRRNSVEMQRLVNILRSSTYNSYNETLAGLSTVRATRQADRFIRRTEDAIDLKNKAQYLTVSMSQWLQFRLSFLGTLVTLGLTFYAVSRRSVTNPADTAVVLNYVLSITAVLSSTVQFIASVEQEMASVQRILAYAELPIEGDGMTLHPPPESWPEEGAIEFKNVDLAYRPGLPDVLRDVSFSIKPGEKVGICGRTGAGKSTILQALLRMFEIKRGTIVLDNQDIGLLEIEGLRTRLGVIPQDSVFLGTVRESSDPLNTRTDAELLEILQHAHLISPGGDNAAAEAKFSLDASLGQEGSGLSAGEKQQLALCRVLVKRCKVVILDEATSSVDVDTDAKLQQTIRAELASSTLLCIAHRLNTILAFDRVLVMDKGQVAEFDTPLALHDKGGLFSALCKEASIGRDDIIRLARAGQPQGADLLGISFEPK